MSQPIRKQRPRRAVSSTLPRPVLWLLGLGGIAAVVVMFLIGYNAPNSIPGRSYYTVTAQFRHANNLTGHYQVRIAGRYVGQVLNPRVKDGMGLVDLQLQPDIAPLRSDTKLRVRPRSPIGVRFVELSPGKSGRPLPDGAMIPAAQTSAATELDTVLNTLDAARRAKARTFLRELGAGTLDRGVDINDVLGTAPSTLRGVDRLIGAVNERAGAPQRLIVGGAAAAAAAEPVRESIRQAFGSGRDALRPLADGRDEVAATLKAAPRSLRAAQAGLQAADHLLTEIRGLSRAAVPALRPARAGLRETSVLLRDSQPGLRSLRTTLDTAAVAVPPTLKLLKDIDPVLPTISSALRSGFPLADRLGIHGCDLGLFTKTWSSFLGFGVGNGRADVGPLNNLRMNMLFNEESLGGATSRSPLVADNPYPAPCTVTQDARNRK